MVPSFARAAISPRPRCAMASTTTATASSTRPRSRTCPPPGGSCNDNGTLTPPCNKGSLACSGAAGWICQNPKNPGVETCDGIDNDCNGAIDDGNLPQVGQACGGNVGECKQGALA